MKDERFVSVILAGGSSRRMGRSKARLLLEGKTLVERQVDVVSPFSALTAVVVTADDAPFFRQRFALDPHVRILLDNPEIQGDGPLAGMYSAMKNVEADTYFVLACDMIHFPSELLLKFKQYSAMHQEFDAIVPVQETRHQPLAAIYRVNPALLYSLLKQNRKSMSQLLNELNVCYVPEKQWRKWTNEPNPFYNMNHAQEYHDMLKNIGNFEQDDE